ncbi:copper resistance CopC family protein [Lentibacillus sediminis]|uniref:copper resistance CopC family protein n=1 Tax=Lentibacillus sediminis TaxID=1940529 RepID=UPI000C1C06F1|nr:copper resistance protein CopC [Lentibacillus sediminis]
MHSTRKLLFTLVAILIFTLLPVHIASAHTTLEESTPAAGEELDEPIDQITLSFSTVIEEGSTLILENQAGDQLEPSSIEITEDIMEASFDEPLEAGEYQANWQIIGADGHVMESSISFSIAEAEGNTAENTEDVTEENNAASDQEENQENASEELGEESATEGDSQTNEENTSPQTSEESGMSGLTIGIIVLLLIAGAGLVAWMVFSKRK